MNLRTEEAKVGALEKIFAIVQETFEIDIKSVAKQGSPVLTGLNRNSIDTEVVQNPGVVEATLFTQSGYGGYLEIGTSKMKAVPYLQPAFDEGMVHLSEELGGSLDG